jgi:hypothetical protein
MLALVIVTYAVAWALAALAPIPELTFFLQMTAAGGVIGTVVCTLRKLPRERVQGVIGSWTTLFALIGAALIILERLARV